jgi:penicillin-binding protein-related factor A (putative recombinase)
MQQETLYYKYRVKPLLDKIPRSFWIKTQFLALLGMPDLIGCVNGYFVALELKRSKKVMKSKRFKLQRWTLTKIIAAGGYAFFMAPENENDVMKVLNKMAKGEIVHREIQGIQVESMQTDDRIS